MNTVTVMQGQSLLDIAIQHTGDLRHAFDIAIKNKMGLTTELTPGMLLLIPNLENNFKNIQFYKRKNARPASADSSLTGIDFSPIPTQIF